MAYRLDSEISPGVARAIDELVTSAPNGHFTQHPGWARHLPCDANERWLWFTGEEGGRLTVAGLVRLREVPLLGYSVIDLFRGPAAVSADALLRSLPALEQLVSRWPLLAVRLDPHWSGPGADDVRAGLAALGYRPMREPPWHTRSLEVDITRPDDALLQSFHATCRRHVRKALQLPIDIREDLDDDGLVRFAALYQAMSDRKGASPRSPAFLRGLRDFCRVEPQRGFLLSSWMRGELLSAVVVFTLGERAAYGYGASTGDDPRVPKSHLLHYVAMQRARARACRVYDLGGFSQGAGNGAEHNATQKVNFFKRGFGGREVGFVEPHERLLRPVRYRLLRAAHHLFG